MISGFFFKNSILSQYFFMKILILAERCNTFLSLRPLRPPWEHLGSPRCFSEASQALHRCFKNYNFGYESGPHGSPRHDTLSQRSATLPPTFLSPYQAPKTLFSTQKSKKSRKSEKLQFFAYFSLFPCLGSYAGVILKIGLAFVWKL